jgi:FAD/FMN-containing dehydrogenase
MTDRIAAFSELLDLLGPVGFLAGADVPVRNCADASVLSPAPPLAVLRPADTRQVSSAMAICARHALPVTVQGGLTGLCGGATPSAGSVALSLERMKRIEEVDPLAMTITVEAGAPLAAVQQAAEAASMFCPVDLGARGSCAIGGNIATNAGGNRVLRYGMTRQSVLGLEVVLADGTVISSMSKMLKNNAGYDLKQLFIGSEGTLGIVTRAVLALVSKPAWSGLAMVAVSNFDAAMTCLTMARRMLGPGLSAFEVLWPDYWRMVTDNVPGRRDPFSEKHGFYFLIEASGVSEERDGTAFRSFIEEAFEAGLVEDAVIAQSLAETERLWAIRDASAEIEAVLGDHESFDVSMSPALLGAYVDEVRTALAQAFPGGKAVFFGHAADGNIHIMASVPGGAAKDRHRLEAIVYDRTQQRSGSISAEHGIGALKTGWLAHSRSKAEILLMRKLKKVLDPDALLNPGKVLSA